MLPAPALVLVAIGSVQLGSALASDLIDDVGAGGATLLRVALAATVLVAAVRPRVAAWDVGAWRAVVALGACMAVMHLCFYASLRYVPLGVAVTVEVVGPLLLALVQARRLAEGAWALLAAGGVGLLGLGTTEGTSVLGLVLAGAAGLCWAGYIVASARVGQALPGVDGLAVALVVATVVVAPFGIAGAADLVGRPSLLPLALAVALLSSVVAYGLELVALRRLPIRVFGVLMSGEPAAAALAGFIVLHESLHPRELVALAMVCAASLGVTLRRR